jgi:tetratricopeptide (TPR) repeat protein
VPLKNIPHKIILLMLLGTALCCRSGAHNNYGLQNTYFEMDSARRDVVIRDLTRKHYKQPSNHAIIRQLAEAYTAKNKPDPALTYWKILSALQPRNDTIYFIQAQLYCDLNRPDKAVKKIQQAIKLRPKNITYLDLLAQIDYRLAKYDTALSLCNDILDKSPNDVNAMLLSGIILRDRKKNDAAMDLFNKCLKIDPANTEALIHRADEYVLRKKYNDALRDYSAARADLSDNADVLNNMGICYYQAEAYQKSIALFNKALHINNFHPQSLFNQGLSFYHMNEPDTAVSDITKASVIWYSCGGDSCHAYFLDAVYYLGMCYKKTGNLKAARRNFLLLKQEKYTKDLTSEIKLIDFSILISRYWYYILLLLLLEIGLVIILGNALKRN